MSERTWFGHFAANKVLDPITITMTLGELRKHIAAGIDAEIAKGGRECEKCSILNDALKASQAACAECDKALTLAAHHNCELDAKIASLRSLAETNGKMAADKSDEIRKLREQLSAAEARAVAVGSVVFTPDGEPRRANPGEYYLLSDDTIVRSPQGTYTDMQVYKRRVV